MKTTGSILVMVATMALLAFSVPVSATEIYGCIELSASQLQKELTTESGKHVEGKADVNNEMTVAKTSEKTQTANENNPDDYDECEDSCQLN